jgi:hypothetical protein
MIDEKDIDVYIPNTLINSKLKTIKYIKKELIKFNINCQKYVIFVIPTWGKYSTITARCYLKSKLDKEFLKQYYLIKKLK